MGRVLAMLDPHALIQPPIAAAPAPAGDDRVNDLVLNFDRLGLPLPWRLDSAGILWAANGRAAVTPDPNGHLSDTQAFVAGLTIWQAVHQAAGLGAEVEAQLAAMEG